MKPITLGFEIGTGKEVVIKPAHLVVTGITNESGKTTCLTGLIKRAGVRAIIFRTKIGEKAISEGTIIPPYYKEEFDWEYASDLLEASRKEKLKFERSWIIKYSKNAKNILEFKANIDKALADDAAGTKKIRELEKSVLVTLQAYLEKVLPEIQYSNLSQTLDIKDGINIMDLESFKEETQALIIKSVLQYVLKHEKNVWVVLPECWKFLPEGLGNPVKRSAEAFVRQGATNGNYLLLDSQDITGVEKSILKQVSIWILGYQREINEIKRTLDQIPVGKKSKPKPDEIATLKLGRFYVATSDFTKKIYAQPAWLPSKLAIQIARGELNVESVQDLPQKLNKISRIKTPVGEEFNLGLIVPESDTIRALERIRKEITELRHDFFDKIEKNNKQIYDTIYGLPNKIAPKEVDVDEIVGKVLQKLPVNNIPAGHIPDTEAIIQAVLKRVPSGGGQVYEVAPVDMLKKKFLQETKDKILEDINQLDESSKRMLKYLEAKGNPVSSLELEEKCFFMKHSGGASNKVSKASLQLRSIGVAHKDTHSKHHPQLKEKIKDMLQNHGATEQEVEQVYQHIVYEILK